MFRLAIDALREMDRRDNRRIDMDYKELTDLAEKAINDIYRVRPCSICACFNNSECDVRCVKCFEDDNHYHQDFKWRGEKEVGYHDAK